MLLSLLPGGLVLVAELLKWGLSGCTPRPVKLGTLRGALCSTRALGGFSRSLPCVQGNASLGVLHGVGQPAIAVQGCHPLLVSYLLVTRLQKSLRF